jgi:hypothetical protein
MPRLHQLKILHRIPFTFSLLAVVSCTLAPMEEPSLPRLHLIEELRLDAEAEDFSAFNRVVVNHAGRIAVPLRQDMHVRVFDSTGHQLATLGRRGSGPGEFQGIGALTWFGDTLLIVGDHQERRIHLFGTDGEFLQTRILPPAWTPAQVQGIEAGTQFLFFVAEMGTPDGQIIGTAMLTEGGSSPPAAGWQRAIVSLSSVGTAQLLATTPSGSDERRMIWINGLGRDIPLVPPPQYAFTADGSRFAYMTRDQSRQDGSFGITVFRADGDTVFTREYPAAGVPIPAVVMDSAIAAMAPRPGQPQEEGAPPFSRFQAEARRRAPAIYAPVERLILALDQTVWVTLRATPEGQDALVLDSLGTESARVQLPPRSHVQQATARHLWVTEIDDDGLTSVVRYRILRQD